eukprot:702256-Amphidinium_carterae.1
MFTWAKVTRTPFSAPNAKAEIDAKKRGKDPMDWKPMYSALSKKCAAAKASGFARNGVKPA